MADESGNSDKEPDYKKVGAVISMIGGAVSVLVGLYSLTGFNPLKELFSSSSSSTSAGTSTSTWTVVREERSRPTTTTRPAPPDFSVRSTQWDGPCGYSWCSMSAVFRNNGGVGNGSATFYVLLPDENQYLALCSTVLPTTAEDSVTSAGCTASSGPLQQYFQSHPGGTVRMDVRVDN
ncbi:hypothetical protein [Amycolatopsis taiwanensis]|uniref:hypothetical protein n=1 Tax=Amycolatopsis taiwanensis TaxID=342230 RepID=UPI00255281AF|nr:hypothetical protein [Amycolatopsis taiwanensis]